MMTNADLRWFRPYCFDQNMAAEKALAGPDGFTDEYFALQSYYARALIDYVSDSAGLRDADLLLEQSELDFQPHAANRDMYQRHFSFGMSFFYLRSPVCVERLDPVDIDLLRMFLSRQADTRDPAVRGLITRTMPTVLRVSYALPDSATIIFSPDGAGARNDALVLGVSAAIRFDPLGYMDPIREQGLRTFLHRLADELEPLLSERLGLPVRILVA